MRLLLFNSLARLLYWFVRPMLWKMDAERTHDRALRFLSHRISRPLRSPPIRSDACEVFGVDYPNRLGLAGGFIKNPEHLNAISRTAFGFVEVGSLTGSPQPGNPLPRLFRFPGEGMILNRMGFNNIGAMEAARLLATVRLDRPLWINIGKSKIAASETEAIADICGAYALLQPFGSVHVFNLASPNTAGLRQLLRPDFLDQLRESALWAKRTRPVLIKVHADLDKDTWTGLVRWLRKAPIDGVLCGNTTIRRDGPFTFAGTLDEVPGGLSGGLLYEIMLPLVRNLRDTLRREQIVVACGGVCTGGQLQGYLQAGASLVQAYTGWIYGGPGWERKVISTTLRRS